MYRNTNTIRPRESNSASVENIYKFPMCSYLSNFQGCALLPEEAEWNFENLAIEALRWSVLGLRAAKAGRLIKMCACYELARYYLLMMNYGLYTSYPSGSLTLGRTNTRSLVADMLAALASVDLARYAPDLCYTATCPDRYDCPLQVPLTVTDPVVRPFVCPCVSSVSYGMQTTPAKETYRRPNLEGPPYEDMPLTNPVDLVAWYAKEITGRDFERIMTSYRANPAP